MSESQDVTKHIAPRETTDSSSSRGSSPGRATSNKQRSVSPECEFNDTIAPQITIRDSSPPTDKSAIRQGLAFRTSTKNIMTYEPSVKTGDAAFLPGQVSSTAPGASPPAPSPVALRPSVASASPTPAPPTSSSNPATPSPHLSAMSDPSDSVPVDKSTTQKGTKKGGKTVPKKAKQIDDTSFTTGRFRLSQYSSTRNDGPPLHHGQGPYASVYRAPLSGVDANPPALVPEPSSSAASTTPTPTSGTRINMLDTTSKATRRSSKQQSIQMTMAPVQDEPPSTSPTQARHRSAYPTRVPPTSHSAQPAGVPPPPSPTCRVPVQPAGHAAAPPMISPVTAPLSASHQSHASHYRRNYEQDIQHTRSEHLHAPPTPVEMNDSRVVDTLMHPPPGESSGPQSKGKEKENPGQRQPQHSESTSRSLKGTIRLVTALIEDFRQDPPDHLLAEMYIRCWAGSRPNELWCDAKDLSEALQSSASRIDGPAKVFTKRGAYRQCFLRISAEQKDRYDSMNLALASDRTIPISVEHWTLPGPQSKPEVDWRMPWHGSPTVSHAQTQPPASQQYHSYQQHAQQPPQHYSQSQQPQPHYQYHDDGRHHVEPSRKRSSRSEQGPTEHPPTSPLRKAHYASQTSNHVAHDPRYEAPTVSLNSSSSYPRKRHLPDVSSPIDNNIRGDGSMDTRPDFKNSGYNQSYSEDVRQKISEIIAGHSKVASSTTNYKRLLHSSVLIDTIKAYRLLDEICTKYVGYSLQVKGATAPRMITEVDIAEGFGADDPVRLVPDSREILRLLDLYGERGKRGENPKVLEMLKENYRPDFSNVNPIQQLRKLLRSLDAQWMREHPGGGGEKIRSFRE